MKKLFPLLALIFILWPSASHKAYASFNYYSPVTVQAAQVPSTQTDFPMLVSYTDARLKSTANGGHVINANGYDIRPYSDSGLTSALTYQLERYNASTGEVVMWVKVPSLAVGSVVYLGYGDAGLNTNGSSASTWDSASQFVQPLSDGTTLSLSDYTTNYTSTNNGATAGTGKIDGGAVLNGSSQNYTVNSVGNAISSDDTHRISFWFNLSADTTGSGAVFFTLGTTWFGQVDSTGEILYWGDTNSGNYRVYGGTTINTATWYKLDMVKTGAGNSGTLYLNGVALTPTSGTLANMLNFSGANMLVGSYTGGGFYVPGTLDMLRVDNTTRSADWITTEYNNQSAPSTFATLGSESSLKLLVIANPTAGGVNGGTTGNNDTTGIAGSGIIMVSVTRSGAATLSDSQSNTWTLVTSETSISGVTNELFVCINPSTSATHTFTISGVGSVSAIAIQVHRGYWSAASGSNHASTAAADSVQTGAVTPAGAGDLILTSVSYVSTTASSINSGFTIASDRPFIGATSYGSSAAFLYASTTNTVNPTWTQTSSAATTLSAGIATFPVGSAPPPATSAASTLPALVRVIWSF